MSDESKEEITNNQGDRSDNTGAKNDSDTPEEERTYIEGFVDGFVETILSPYKWIGIFLGGIFK